MMENMRQGYLEMAKKAGLTIREGKVRTSPKPEQTRGEKKRGCSNCERGLKRLVRGARGWAKLKLGKGLAPDQTVAERQAICEKCPSNCFDFGICSEEKGGCGCILWAKARVASEVCPHGHWQAVTVEGKMVV